MTDPKLAARIQHTLYDLGTSRADVERHCNECIEFGFAAAMVPARFVGSAVQVLTGSGIPVATAVDFPVGMMTVSGRIAESISVVEAGAHQIDIGVPIGLLKDGEDGLFADSIRRVVEAVRPVPIKVMLELPLLSEHLAARAVKLAVDAGARWLKNASSGSVGKATVEDIRFLRTHAPLDVHVKASGGIHSAADVEELLAAGADLVGTSSGISIVSGATTGWESGY